MAYRESDLYYYVGLYPHEVVNLDIILKFKLEELL